MSSVAENRRKFNEKDIGIEDLPPYLQRKATPNAKVHILKVGKWELIGEMWVLVKEVCETRETPWAIIVVHKSKPFWGLFLLPFAKKKEKGNKVSSWSEIPGTNIFLDFWYIGDGTEGTPIAFECR